MKSPLVKMLTFCLIAAMPPFLLSAPTDSEAIGTAVPAEVVCSMYVTNSLKMEKYEKKRRQVHGKVFNLGRTGNGFPYILLYGGEGALFGVKCVFPKEDAPKLSNLVIAMHVIIEGELQGRTDDVIFTECTLLKTF